MTKSLKLLAIALLCSCSNNDVKNAHVFGTLVDHTTQKPLKGKKLMVQSAYYQGGDYDSYNGYVDSILTTDENGRFEGFFDKICYIQIRAKTAQGDTLLYAHEIFSKEKRIDLAL
ncbi:hypothetical protein [Hymenobacter sp. PAMC 26628]|uniref:hypothetical protein n=1 Tax=Hymenobacter sp. PAMC 26628 TaxID=1484118 RepID=UPI0007702C59|nr:hypothetical protein [Hymenobacter sp. PAMC 26628]AMJ65552.1 hypothetical protein AXW84_08995 [Hymenobacter sp. PAMC 26628]